LRRLKTTCQVILELLSLPTSDFAAATLSQSPRTSETLNGSLSTTRNSLLSAHSMKETGLRQAPFWKEVGLRYSGQPKCGSAGCRLSRAATPAAERQCARRLVLREWMLQNFVNPFPSKSDKYLICAVTSLSRTFVTNWFINARTRIWRPLMLELGNDMRKAHVRLSGVTALLQQ